MTVSSVSSALARIASIQARFAPQMVAPRRVGAQAAGVQAAGPQAVGLQAAGPQAVGVQAAGPHEFVTLVQKATRAQVPGGVPAGSAQPWVQRLPERGQRWAQAITDAASPADLDPALLAAVVWAESAFDPDAVSSAGARGLAQLMPATARGLGVDIGDAEQNLAGGARYLRAQLDRFGALDLALAAYNAGPGAVAGAGGVPAFAETRAYVPRVLDYYRRLQGA